MTLGLRVPLVPDCGQAVPQATYAGTVRGLTSRKRQTVTRKRISGVVLEAHTEEAQEIKLKGDAFLREVEVVEDDAVCDVHYTCL